MLIKSQLEVRQVHYQVQCALLIFQASGSDVHLPQDQSSVGSGAICSEDPPVCSRPEIYTS